GPELSKLPSLRDVPEWQLAVVIAVSGKEVDIGLQPATDGGGQVEEPRKTGVIKADNMKWAYRDAKGERKTAKSPEGVLEAGDVVYVVLLADEEILYRLIMPLDVHGGFVAMDFNVVRVLAMTVGFFYSQSEFNLATQAMRQPGSA